MHESSWQNHVLAKSAVDRWRREELHIRAEVVTTRSALMARATWHTWFHCDRRALSKIVHTITKALHDTGGFVTEHQRPLHNEVGDSTMLEVVNVASADPDGLHSDEDFPWTRFGNRALTHRQRQVRVEDAYSLHT